MNNIGKEGIEDGYSLTYGKNSQHLPRRHSYDLRLKFVKETLTKNNCNSILDIGSATGDYAIDIKNSGFNVICADINVESLKIAKRKEDDLAASAVKASVLPFKRDSFDAIMILNALRYFGDPLLPLGECNRVLKNDGNLILICHNRFCPDTLITKRGGSEYLTLNKLKGVLKKSNFEILKEDLFFVPPPFIPGPLLNTTLNLGTKLNRLHLKNILPEIFIHAVKGDVGGDKNENGK